MLNLDFIYTIFIKRNEKGNILFKNLKEQVTKYVYMSKILIRHKNLNCGVPNQHFTIFSSFFVLSEREEKKRKNEL